MLAQPHAGFIQLIHACMHAHHIYTMKEMKQRRNKMLKIDEKSRMLLRTALILPHMKRVSAKSTNQFDCGSDFTH